MAASGLSTWTTFSLVQSVLILIIFMAGNSAALGSTGSQASTLNTKTQGHQNLTVNSKYSCPRRCWATRSRRNHSEVAFGESYSEASRSIFKHADHCDKTSVLIVSADGSAEYSSTQDAIDQVPDNNTRRTTIYITRGVYEEKVLIPITKPYITLQGEGRHRSVITWNDTAAAAGITYMSASVVVEADHFIARDISFKNSAGSPAPNRMNMQAAAFRISGDKAFLYQCNFLGYQDTLYDHEGRHYYFRDAGCIPLPKAKGAHWWHKESTPPAASWDHLVSPSWVVLSRAQVNRTLAALGASIQLLFTPTARWTRTSSPTAGTIGVCQNVTEYGVLCSFINPSWMYWKGSQYDRSSSVG